MVPGGTQDYVNLSIVLHLYCSARHNVNKGNWAFQWSCFIRGRLKSSSTLLREPQISQPWPLNSDNWQLWWLENSPTNLLQYQGLAGTSMMKLCCSSLIEYLFLSSIMMFTRHCLENEDEVKQLNYLYLQASISGHYHTAITERTGHFKYFCCIILL